MYKTMSNWPFDIFNNTDNNNKKDNNVDTESNNIPHANNPFDDLFGKNSNTSEAEKTEEVVQSDVKDEVEDLLNFTLTEEPKEEKTDIKEPEKQKKAEELTSEKVDESVSEEGIKEESPKETVKEKTVEEVKETKPKTRRRGRKPKAEMVEKTEEQQDDIDNNDDTEPEVINVSVNPKSMNFQEIVQSIAPDVSDQEWDDIQAYIEQQLNNIKIEEDLTPGTMRIMLPVIKNLIFYISPVKAYYESLNNIFNDKTNGILGRQKNVNAVGKDAKEREKNGCLACENYQFGNQTVNLFDIRLIIEYRRNYLISALDMTNKAYQILVSYLSLFKNEEKI